jgi:hypothetical protein
MAHEGDIFFDPEKFHGLFLLWAPDLADSEFLNLLVSAVPEIDKTAREENSREHGSQNT